MTEAARNHLKGLCASCRNRVRYTTSWIDGSISGVVCMAAHNDVVSPVPSICSDYDCNVKSACKDQQRLFPEDA